MARNSNDSTPHELRRKRRLGFFFLGASIVCFATAAFVAFGRSGYSYASEAERQINTIGGVLLSGLAGAVLLFNAISCFRTKQG